LKQQAQQVVGQVERLEQQLADMDIDLPQQQQLAAVPASQHTTGSFTTKLGFPGGRRTVAGAMAANGVAVCMRPGAGQAAAAAAAAVTASVTSSVASAAVGEDVKLTFVDTKQQEQQQDARSSCLRDWR
jgi:hypothetical protein